MKKELLTVCSLMLATASFAAMPAGRFKAMDTDKDGTVTKVEYIASATARFVSKDKNSDGFQDATEADAKSIKRFDKDKDGKLSLAESIASQTRTFEKNWDKNKDGVLNDLDK